MRTRIAFVAGVMLLVSSSFLAAQDQPAGGAAQEPPPATQAPANPSAPPARDPRPYAQVITRDAVTDDGVFKVHRVRDRLYYEIPREMLGREFLWVSQIAKTTLGAGYGGQQLGDRVVKWERRDNRILLRAVSYDLVADSSTPIVKAVQAANFDPVVMAFNVETLGPNNAPVIDVTRLFTTDVPEFSARTRVRARAFDAQRSFVERAVSFPENIEVEALQTFNNPPDAGAAPAAPAGGRGGPPRTGSASIVMHYSMVLLPEKPMRPRVFDERVGYFSLRQLDYGRDEHRTPERRYITRWRLEKRDPNAAVSEPIKPIVYWVDPATPTKWVPWVKRGIEAWQPAFEAAGFRSAIIAKEAPSPAQDPDWSPEDARYSVVRWLPSTTENASGPHIHDPRSGEILESDIQMHHNVMNLVRNWYFVQAGPLDPRTKTLPLPDDLMGRLLEFVVAHEVGHTLGFQHNMKASSMYPAAKVRDKAFVKENSHTPSIMDYSRFNYVAQPEDGIPVEDLVPRVGPYDKFATMWGYKPIPEARSSDDEKATLDAWAREQDTNPHLRFSTSGSGGSDPGELSEAVGDEDAVASTALGLKNLERVSAMLMPAAQKSGDDYDDLNQLYGRMLSQWALELNHVAAIVGGFNSQQKHWGQNGVRFTPIPKARQAAAVAFLNQHAFRTPAFLVNPEILRRVEPTGAIERIGNSQQRVLESLLSSARVSRLVEQELIDGAAAYKPTDLLTDVRRGVWAEIHGQTAPKIDAYRRHLQRAYVTTLANRVNGRQAAASDARALFRAELKLLEADIRRALMRTVDYTTRAHLDDTRTMIARALDPTVLDAAAGAPTAPRPTLDSEFNPSEFDPFDVTIDRGICWW